MDWANRRERFRATLDRGRCIHPASVYDPISARIAEDLGFEAGMLAGSVASLAVLGAPDIVLLTLTEFAAQAYRLNRAVLFHLFNDQDRVDLFRLFKERDHRVVNASIERRVKVFGFEMFDRLRDQRVVEQYRAKYDALRVFAARQRTLEVLFTP